MIVVISVSIASAQTRPPRRPVAGLFGGHESNPASRQSLDLLVSLYAGYDDNRSDVQGDDLRLQPDSSFLGSSLEVIYNRKAKVSLGATGGGAFRYLPDEQRVVVVTSHASVGAAGTLGRRMSFSAAQSVNYSPYFRFDVFPSLLAAGGAGGFGSTSDADFSLFDEQSQVINYDTTLELRRRLLRRSSVNLLYGDSRGDLDGTDFDYRNRRIASTFSSAIGPNTALRLGYGYRTFRPGRGAAETTAHDIDIGVDYARSLALSRRTTVGFGVGSSIIATQQQTESDGGRDTGFFISGYASLNRVLNKRWTAVLEYRRGIDFNAGLSEPLLTDAVAAGVNGAVGRRLDLSFSVAAAAGAVGAVPGSGGFDSYTASARSEIRLSQFAWLYAHYFYYHYDFDGRAVLSPNFLPQFDRQGVRGGLRLLLPLLR
jgi:hypothetical protein